VFIPTYIVTSTEYTHIEAPSFWNREHHSGEHSVVPLADVANVLEDLFGSSALADARQSVALAARAPLPTTWPSQYRFAIVRRGHLIRQRTNASGHTTAVDAVGPGGCFPLDAQAAEGGAGYVVTRALVSLVDESSVTEALQQGGQTALQIHQLNAQTVARMERLIDARGRSGSAGKVAALLCVLADTLEQPGTGDGNRIPGEFLQRDLAGLLSIRHESVCRALRAFTGRGWITKTDDALVLKDRAALAAV
jgi:CRP-like cAMP-binding protein